MKKTTNNRVNMLTSVSRVLTQHQTTWQDHEAFAEGVTAFLNFLPDIEEQSQIILGTVGAASAKKLAARALNTAAVEIMGAVASYAEDNAEAGLGARVAYSESGVTRGKTSDVVARCKNIHAAATENLAALGKYGVTADKLTTFNGRISAFDRLKVAPRDNVVTRRAAGEFQEQLLRDANTILRDKLDRLVVQFKAADPTFYEAYYAARVVVDARGGSSLHTDVQPGNPSPAPAPAPVTA